MTDKEAARAALLVALQNETLTQADVLGILAEAATETFPSYAEQVDTTDELELDAAPLYSRSDHGVWVSAWVYVADSEEE